MQCFQMNNKILYRKRFICSRSSSPQTFSTSRMVSTELLSILFSDKVFWGLSLIAYSKKAADVDAALRQPTALSVGHSSFERFIAFLIYCFGGSITMGILLGHGPSVLTHDKYFLAAIAIWALFRMVPFGIVGKIFAFPPIRFLTIAIQLFVDGVSIKVAGVDRVCSADHSALQTYSAMFVCGFLCINAGGLLSQLFNLNGEWKFQRSTSLKTFAFNLKMALFTSALYTSAKYYMKTTMTTAVAAGAVKGYPTELALSGIVQFIRAQTPLVTFLPWLSPVLLNLEAVKVDEFTMRFLVGVVFAAPVLMYYVANGAAFYIIPPAAPATSTITTTTTAQHSSSKDVVYPSNNSNRNDEGVRQRALKGDGGDANRRSADSERTQAGDQGSKKASNNNNNNNNNKKKT